jgi:hypothetical protein
MEKTLTYASETWILTKRDRKPMNIFERKLYKKIIKLFKNPTTTEIIRLHRLQWFEHVQRMEENRIPKRVFR